MILHKKIHSKQKQFPCRVTKKENSGKCHSECYETNDDIRNIFSTFAFGGPLSKEPEEFEFGVQQQYGCGLCDEIFLEETHFMVHCSGHSL